MPSRSPNCAACCAYARAQLVPFIAGMPKRGNPAEPAPLGVTQMLLRSPPIGRKAAGAGDGKR